MHEKSPAETCATATAAFLEERLIQRRAERQLAQKRLREAQYYERREQENLEAHLGR